MTILRTGRTAVETDPLPPTARGEAGQDHVLSSQQLRVWLIERLQGSGGAYNLPRKLRLRGELDGEALRRALERVVARHDVLRTTFRDVGGTPVQRVDPGPAPFPLKEHDLRGVAQPEAALAGLIADEAEEPFNLANGPLARGRLVRMAPDDHVLLLTLHHLVADSRSLGILMAEASNIYASIVRGEPDPLPPLPLQYADYAAAQAVACRIFPTEQVEYWRRTLAGAPELLQLPTDRRRPPRWDFAGDFIDVGFDEVLTAGLKALSRRHRTTLFMTILAAWGVVLSKLSGQSDVVVGITAANRDRNTSGLIGFFANTLPVRLDLSAAKSVGDVLLRAKERAREAQRNQDVPFEHIVEIARPARSLAQSPLFQVMFVWLDRSEGGLDLPGLEPAPTERSISRRAKFDLTLRLHEERNRIVGGVEYATALFDRGTVEQYAGYLREVLVAMVADDTEKIESLQLLPPAERARVVKEWNATDTRYREESCIHELVEREAFRIPDAVALTHGAESVSYAELNARANRLAHALIERGVGPEKRVALCVRPCVEMVVGVLGVLKAGGAYVPVDPEYPAERVGYMLADSEPTVLLTQAGLVDRCPAVGGTEVLELDDHSVWVGRPDVNPERGPLSPDHLAYVIYTSGSTGRPKGVMISHRNAVNLIEWAGRAFDPAVFERTLFSTSLSFDLAVFECFVPLTVGGSVELVPNVLRWSTDASRVTLVNTVPSAMAALVDGGGIAPSVRVVNLAGEPLQERLVEAVFQTSRVDTVCNLYGPSETTTYSTWVAMDRRAGFDASIGRPIDNTRIYILGGRGEPVPVGAVGELYIGGVGVARGYHKRPDLTAERFLADPYGDHPGARLYRTGDLGRWRSDGSIEFLGRNDHQVKVRGYRVELGEIEARLREHRGVREAVVVAELRGSDERRLVAYWVGAEGVGESEPVGAEALRLHLIERLPSYMVPDAYVRLEALPQTPNGKLDRDALPAPEDDAYARRSYEAPVGDAEAVLADIWSEVLGIEHVGRHDLFFELGGNSLHAIQVASRIRRVLGLEMNVDDLFVYPVLRDFARRVTAARRVELPPLEAGERGHRRLLSFAQQRLWFLDQMGGRGDAYQLSLRFRIRGKLDRVALRRALDRIVDRHETLRTTFGVVDGEAEQLIAPAGQSAFALTYHDGVGDAEGNGRSSGFRPEAPGRFDLAVGPLIRGRLERLGPGDHVLTLTAHHIVADGWSMTILQRELSALYAAFVKGEPDPLEPLPIQYVDYAAWQRRWAKGERLEHQAAYWKAALDGAPERLELPTDHPRPVLQDHASGMIEVRLDEELTSRLRALGRRHGTTMFMTLLAAWAVVLTRLSGQKSVVIGTPTANRSQPESEALIGLFVNTLAIHVDLTGNPTVPELLARVRERSLGAQQNQDIPFEQVVELVQPARGVSYSPLFQVMFAWRNMPQGSLQLPGAEVVPVPGLEPSAKFDLTLDLGESNGRVIGKLIYAAALFDRATIARHRDYLLRVLEGMVADEQRTVEAIELLSAAERTRLLRDWNATARPCTDERCLHELFEAQVMRTPDAVAAVQACSSLTYGALNARADALASRLQSLGVGPDACVALAVDRSLEMLIGMLAVLKAGGAYLPLDPASPPERLRWLLRDSRPIAIVTRGARVGQFDVLDLPVLDLDGGGEPDPKRPRQHRGGGRESPRPGHLAYAIYTSGSAGRPKAVMVSHRSICNQIIGLQRRWGVDARDRVLQFAAFTFDVSVEEIFLALLSGAALILRDDGWLDGAQAFWGACEAERVSFVNLPTRFWQVIMREGAPRGSACVRLLVVGGEAMDTSTVDTWFRCLAARGDREGGVARPSLVNAYGPTEATVNATVQEVTENRSTWRSIGRPLANTRVYVLDEHGEVTPVGVAGELHIGGVGVARGYLRRPDLTAIEFTPDPFGGEPGARLYRTGDRARWRPDGTLEFLGRTDLQLKIRGYRIELGEIEAMLKEHPAVHDAVVVAHAERSDVRELVAYYLGEDVGAEALRSYLCERLPKYMVPAAYVHLASLPLTSNGKYDRAALPVPERDDFAFRRYEAPANETEATVARIWSEVLGGVRVGRWDDFFELGGHSLLLIRATELMKRAQLDVGVLDVSLHPTVESLAAKIDRSRRRGSHGSRTILPLAVE